MRRADWFGRKFAVFFENEGLLLKLTGHCTRLSKKSVEIDGAISISNRRVRYLEFLDCNKNEERMNAKKTEEGGEDEAENTIKLQEPKN